MEPLPHPYMEHYDNIAVHMLYSIHCRMATIKGRGAEGVGRGRNSDDQMTQCMVTADS